VSILDLDPLTRRLVTFRAVAVPVTKGSVRAFTPAGWSRPVLTSTSTGLKAWEAVVRHAATEALRETWPRGVGVRVDLAFILPRPQAHPKRRAIAHTKKPDLDKLTRAVLDALTGVAYADDAQVCRMTLDKRYAEPTEQPGVIVAVGLAGDPT